MGHSLLLTVCLCSDCPRGGGVTHDCCCSVPAATTSPQPQHAVTNSSTVVPGNMPPWSYSAQGPALLTPLAAFFMRQSGTVYLHSTYLLDTTMLYTAIDKYLIGKLNRIDTFISKCIENICRYRDIPLHHHKRQ